MGFDMKFFLRVAARADTAAAEEKNALLARRSNLLSRRAAPVFPAYCCQRLLTTCWLPPSSPSGTREPHYEVCRHDRQENEDPDRLLSGGELCRSLTETAGLRRNVGTVPPRPSVFLRRFDRGPPRHAGAHGDRPGRRRRRHGGVCGAPAARPRRERQESDGQVLRPGEHDFGKGAQRSCLQPAPAPAHRLPPCLCAVVGTMPSLPARTSAVRRRSALRQLFPLHTSVQIDESLLANAYAWMRKASDDSLDGMVRLSPDPQTANGLPLRTCGRFW